MSSADPRAVLLDVDAGSDDAWAIMVYLALEASLGLKLIGITCGNGNTKVDYVCRNVLLTLEAMDRTDIPVYRGAEDTLIGNTREGTEWHGQDGFGDRQFSDPVAKIQDENAILAINRLASENKGLAVIALGPLTNLALALRINPQLKSNIGELWIMGGNIHGVGNIANTSAEFNFGTDPEAAHIVLNSGISPITILPYEPTMDAPFSLDWRFNVLGFSANKHVLLINEIDRVVYKNSTCWNPCDAFAVAAFLNNGTIKSVRDVNMQVELHGTFTRGQSVILSDNKPNVRVIQELDYQIIRDLFLETSNYKCSHC